MLFLQRFELSRIAIGSMVRETGCQAVYNENNRELSLIYQRFPGTVKRMKRTAPKIEIIPIPLTELGFVGDVCCYADASEGCLNFLSSSILSGANEELAKFHDYDPESTENSKKYIMLEFKTWLGLAELQTDLSEDHLVRGRLSLENSPDAVLEYSELLIKQEANRKASKEPSNPYKKDRDDKIILVHPFAGDNDKMEAAADGLKEPSGAPLVEECEVPHDARAAASEQTDSTKIAEGRTGEVSQFLDAPSPAQSAAFAGDKDKMEAAADGLKEVSEAPLVEACEVSHDAQAAAPDQIDATKMAEGTTEEVSQ
jgi:hypothetical protein